jgi:hypothetical protein
MAKPFQARASQPPDKMKAIARIVFVFFVMAVLAMYFFGERFAVLEQPSAMSYAEFVRAHGPTNADDAAVQSDAEDQMQQAYQSYLNEWQQGQMKAPVVGPTSAISKKITDYKTSWQRVYAALSMQRAVESPRIKAILASMGVWVTFAVLVSGIIAANIAIGYLEQKARK